MSDSKIGGLQSGFGVRARELGLRSSTLKAQGKECWFWGADIKVQGVRFRDGDFRVYSLGFKAYG